MTHQHLTDAFRASVALYAFGGLDPEEARSFVERLNAEGAPGAEELRAYERIVGLLGYHAPAIQPRPELRAQLLDGLTPKTTQAAAVGQRQPDLAVDVSRYAYMRANEGHWRELAPGVSEKILGFDAVTERSTALIRMAPGTWLPPHKHLAVEEVFVLEGACYIAPGQVVRTGDYFRAVAGSEHGAAFTEDGVTLLVVSWNATLAQEDHVT
jgi:anti-sigma factor ChrR (cupin superfamily)